MFIAFLILFFVGLIVLGKKGEKFFKQKALDKEEENRFEREYKDRTLRALEQVSYAVTPEEPITQEPSLLENFLEGNKKLEEKRQVRQAMIDELGIH